MYSSNQSENPNKHVVTAVFAGQLIVQDRPEVLVNHRGHHSGVFYGDWELYVRAFFSGGNE